MSANQRLHLENRHGYLARRAEDGLEQKARKACSQLPRARDEARTIV